MLTQGTLQEAWYPSANPWQHSTKRLLSNTLPQSTTEKVDYFLTNYVEAGECICTTWKNTWIQV